jgi:multiple sugar transport system substrate-binding protein
MKPLRNGIVVLLVLLVSLTGFVVADAQEYPDFGGQTITITTWSSRPQRYLDEYAPGRLEEAEELFNCKIVIEVFPKGELAGINMNRLLSGDSAYDIWNMEHDQFWPLVTQGALLDVTGILPADYYDNLHPLHQRMANAWRFLGKNYYVGAAPAAYSAAYFLLYNKDLVEAEGIDDPYELWLEGEWDWDNFERLMREVTKDTDGDGEIDQYGFNHKVHYQNWIPTNGANVVKEIDGKMVFALHHEDAIYGLNKLYEWRSEGLMELDIPPEKALFSMIQGWDVEYRALDWDGYRYAFVPYPAGPHADPDFYLAPFWAQLGFALPANSARPREIVQVLDYLYPPEEFEEYLDSMIRTMVLDRDSYNAAQWMYENAEVAVNFWKTILPSDEYDLLAVEATDDGGAASKMAAIAPAVQTLIDDLFGQ